MISEDARNAIWLSRVLTDSVSWDLESPCSFNHFEVAMCGCNHAYRRSEHKGKVVATARNEVEL